MISVPTDGKEDSLSLGQILSFFSGREYPPPLGFDSKISIHFNADSMFLTASTCALHLTLPTKYYNDEQEFQKNMVYGMLNHGGFGRC